MTLVPVYDCRDVNLAKIGNLPPPPETPKFQGELEIGIPVMVGYTVNSFFSKRNKMERAQQKKLGEPETGFSISLNLLWVAVLNA